MVTLCKGQNGTVDAGVRPTKPVSVSVAVLTNKLAGQGHGRYFTNSRDKWNS
jgi:hypothetical protein